MKKLFTSIFAAAIFLNLGACASQVNSGSDPHSQVLSSRALLKPVESDVDFLELEKDFDKMSGFENFDSVELSSRAN